MFSTFFTGRANRWMLAGLAAACAASTPVWADTDGGQAVKPDCDHACLEGFVNRYMAALIVRNPDSLPWAPRVRFSENNVMLRVGDGAWHVADRMQPDGLVYSDPQTGEAGFMGVIDERGSLSFYGMRLKVEDGKISEVESLVNTPDPSIPPSPAGGDPKAYVHYPQMTAILPLDKRTPRRRMIDIANGYFSTLQLNDGTLLTQFTDDCKRMENGFESSGNARFARPEGKLSCGEQFKTGTFIFDSAVRDRDYMLVDEERGLLLARAVIDHDAAADTARLPDGRIVKTFIKTPDSLMLYELFHITAGKLDRIEVVHVGVPYKMPSVWRRDPE